METQPASRLHPMLWVAAISVTAASAVAIGSMTGWLHTNAQESPAPSAVASTETAKPAEPPRTAAQEPPVAMPAKPSPNRARARPPEPATHAAAPPDYTPPPRDAAPPPRCNDCGVVDSIRAVSREGDGSGVGAVAGGALGGVLGNGVGHGNGRALATIAGVVGGAMLGNKIEKDQKKTTYYESSIRMEDGTRQIVTTDAFPVWKPGEPVRVNQGVVSPR